MPLREHLKTSRSLAMVTCLQFSTFGADGAHKGALLMQARATDQTVIATKHK